MNKQVYIRADGNNEIGLGHLVRCIAMAHMLKEEFEITFFCFNIPAGVKNEIRKSFNFKAIEDEDNFISQIDGDKIVILDGYIFSSEYQKKIKDSRASLVVIDDLHDRLFFADLIVNHAPGVKPAAYTAKPYTQFALGLDYVLLRPPFLEVAKTFPEQRSLNKALVCFGGSDPRNFTQTAVDVLREDPRFDDVSIIIGADYAFKTALLESIKGQSKFKIFSSISSEEVTRIMTSCGLAIVPASGVLQEAVASGCRIIAGMYAENQNSMFNNYKQLGAFESSANFSPDNIKSAINAVFSKPAAPVKLIDGKSGERISKYFRQLIREKEVYLRPASAKDIKKTFEWANSSEIRKFSFNKKPIELGQHTHWFEKKLSDKNCYYYIGATGGQDFGSIRFDVDQDVATISYLIDPIFQSRGLAAILVKKGIISLCSEGNDDIKILHGEVFEENHASVRIFNKMGFSITSSEKPGVTAFEKNI